MGLQITALLILAALLTWVNDVLESVRERREHAEALEWAKAQAKFVNDLMN